MADAAGDGIKYADRDYGRAGWIGIGTPQANPTVEAEMAILLPRGCALAATRLTSKEARPDGRLRAYLADLETTLGSYDSFRPDAYGFACTGSTYLLGHDAERQIVDRCTTIYGYPIVTATMAIEWALARIGARRIAMIAPYPDELIEAGRAYWESRGIAIVSLERLHTTSSDTRTIYELRAGDAEAALARVDTGQIDAVLLSGTGLATLPLIAAWNGAVPLLSSNLCLVARLLALCGQESAVDPASLRPLGFEARLAEARGEGA